MRGKWLLTGLVPLLALAVLPRCSGGGSDGDPVPTANAWDAYAGNWRGSADLGPGQAACTYGDSTITVELSVRSDGSISYLYRVIFSSNDVAQPHGNPGPAGMNSVQSGSGGATVQPVWSGANASWDDCFVSFSGRTATFFKTFVPVACADGKSAFSNVTVFLDRQ